MAQSTFKEKDLQVIIGWILRAGVFISMTVVLIGGALYLYRHGRVTADYHDFKGQPDFVQLPGIWHGILTLRGRSIIQAGILLLIATPVVRVIFSAIGFVLEKDRLYTFITLLVLMIIVGSMLTGHAG